MLKFQNKKMHALLSVSDKKDIVPFAQSLIKLGYKIISTGGTHDLLNSCGVPAAKVSDLTVFPEILGGRVKTLHPTIFGGILADRANEDHIKDIQRHKLPDIQLVVVNLYPFWEVTAQTPETQAIEQIDIGGVSLIRAAAKNFKHVTVLTNPNQNEMFCQQQSTIELRREFARCAFELTAKYDACIAKHFSVPGMERLKNVNLPDRFKQTREYELVAPLK